MQPDFLKRPTPGASNSRRLEGFLRRVYFSQDHGFFGEPFALSLETSTKETVIRYTLDGSEPKSFTGLEYTGPIEINSTTILRARAFRDGYHESPVATRTYLFLHDVVHQSPHGEPPPGWPYGRVNRYDLQASEDSQS